MQLSGVTSNALRPTHLQGVDIYNESATVTDIFGDQLKGRMLQEAIWSTYQVPGCQNTTDVDNCTLLSIVSIVFFRFWAPFTLMTLMISYHIGFNKL